LARGVVGRVSDMSFSCLWLKTSLVEDVFG
jgi:hypothetical protein